MATGTTRLHCAYRCSTTTSRPREGEESDVLKMTAGTADEIQGIVSYAQIDRSQENG